MDKYSEVKSAVEALKSTIEMPEESVKNYDSGYTMDTIVYKKDSILFPKEIEEIIQEEGNLGMIEGVSSLWGSTTGKLVIWDYKTRMINEVELKSQKAHALYKVKPGAGIFTSDVQHCILLFTDKSINILCLCKNPVTYVSMDMSVDFSAQISCVCETDDGRIFMGGSDGNIYEFIYREKSWLKGHTTKVVCHTQGVMNHLLPFLYAVGHKAGVKQMVATYKTLLVLFQDNTVEVYETGKSLKKIRVANYPEIAPGMPIQLVKRNGKIHQAYLILPNGTRLFLDCMGYMLGKRPMPSTRLRSRMAIPSTIKDEIFYQTGKNLVSIGKKNGEAVLTVISSNTEDKVCIENCSAIVVEGEYREISVSSGTHWENQAEALITGEEVAFLGPNRVDIYHIMGGTEVMERASTNPEGIFAYIQRNGAEKALTAALYAVAEGAASPAIDSLFKKTENLQKKAICACAGMLVYKVWSINIYDVLREKVRINIGEYISEIDQAIEKTKKIRNYVIKECTDIRNIRISEETLIDMLNNILETLYYLNILMESDAMYIFEEAEKKSEEQLHFTLSSFLMPVAEIRKATLNVLVDINLAQRASIDGITMELNERCSSIFALTDTLLLKGKETVEKASRATSEEDRKWYLMKSMEFLTKTPARNYLPEIVEIYSSIRFSKGILCAVQSGFNSITERQAEEYLKKIEYTEEILQEGLRDERPSFCNSLLKSAVKKIKEGEFSADALLKITSPLLEEYLDKLDMASDSLDMCDLIWKYHLKNKNYYVASLYLLRSAERIHPIIGLQKRIEYLSIANTMQLASQRDGEKPVVTGSIKNYAFELGTDAKERLKMAQVQLQVMSALSCKYKIDDEEMQEKNYAEITFKKLDKILHTYEQLFEICVVFGFSVLALKIGSRGEIEDRHLLQDLWEDALSGSYTQGIEILKENPDIVKEAPIELVFSILLQKKIDAPQEGNNIGSDLVEFGASVMKVARMLDIKATGTEYPNPSSKKVVIEQATAFCEENNLTELAHKLTSFRISLGIS